MFSVILLFVKPLSALFFVIYIVCGASDILDGRIARKAKTESKFGATLDSIADAVFIGVLLIILIPVIDMSMWMLVWLVCIVIIRLSSLLTGFIRYHALAFLHTYGNKAAGLLLFCFPLLYQLFGIAITAFLLCSMASISAIEELAINITSKELSRDIKSIFLK